MQEDILEDQLDLDLYQLRITLTNGREVHIRYNEMNEYAYQVLYSYKKLDRIRFDNVDHKFEADRTHHVHLRYTNDPRPSHMTGNPSEDIPLFIKYIFR